MPRARVTFERPVLACSLGLPGHIWPHGKISCRFQNEADSSGWLANWSALSWRWDTVHQGSEEQSRSRWVARRIAPHRLVTIAGIRKVTFAFRSRWEPYKRALGLETCALAGTHNHKPRRKVRDHLAHDSLAPPPAVLRLSKGALDHATQHGQQPMRFHGVVIFEGC